MYKCVSNVFFVLTTSVHFTFDWGNRKGRLGYVSSRQAQQEQLNYALKDAKFDNRSFAFGNGCGLHFCDCLNDRNKNFKKGVVILFGGVR